MVLGVSGMFDILFGWRKASKCKRLIRQVQCRLKLLKNKRSSIVRQLREDMAHLIKHGHEQVAFNKVEQLFKDESTLAMYDLLDQFCEFIIINFSYIRKHKDCPNDINEAVSSLIYASARFGDLPELPAIRKLFGERYGQRFAAVAVESLPGNLVNSQIRDSLSIKLVPDEVKCGLMNEIRRVCLVSGPLALEFSSEAQLEAYKSKWDQVQNGDLLTNCCKYEESELQDFVAAEAQGEIVCDGILPGDKKLLIESLPSRYESKRSSISAFSESSPRTDESWMQKEEAKVQEYSSLDSPSKFTISGERRVQSSASSGTHEACLGENAEIMVSESSSESPPNELPEEMTYLDDIEELESPIRNDQDQRLFKFKAITPTREKFKDGQNGGGAKKQGQPNVGSRIHRKIRKAKRSRNSSISSEGQSVTDVECSTYYGNSSHNSSSHGLKYHHRRKHQKKYPKEEEQRSDCAHEAGHQGQIHSSNCCRLKGDMIKNCNLDHPCYDYISDDKSDWESWSWKPKCRITTLEEKFHIETCDCHCSSRDSVILPQKPRRIYPDCPAMSETIEKRKESRHSYSRAATMPSIRPTKDSCSDSILRANSFPIQAVSSPHVHPKLPDYDELAAKFMALKKANLNSKLNS